MSTKLAQKMILLEKLQMLTPLQKLPKNVGDLGKVLLPQALKSCPKTNKSPNLVTLAVVKSLLCNFGTKALQPFSS